VNLKAEIELRVIQKEFFVDSFNCGEQTPNFFLKNLAYQNLQRRLGVTVTAIAIASKEVVGYYTLCPAQIDKQNLPKKFGGVLPTSVPAILLARLAVDNSFQGKGLGSLLLAHALEKAYKQSLDFGGYLVLVEALHEKAKAFYDRFGVFTLIRKEPFLLGVRTKILLPYIQNTKNSRAKIAL